VDDDLLELNDQPPSVGSFADDLPASVCAFRICLIAGLLR
jgi:hypothetical protein